MLVRILGPLEMRADSGTPITTSRPLVRAAICVFVLHAGRPVPPARLRDLLWGPDDSSDRAGSIKTCAWNVRRALPPGRLMTENGNYLLRLRDGDFVDLRDFRAFVTDARQAKQRGNPTEAATLYQRGLDLWREPPLVDMPRTSVAQGIVVGLLAERRVVREELVETRLDLGHESGLIPVLRTWLAEEPLNEHLWGQLMVAVHRHGNKAEAAAIFEEARQALSEAADVGPGPDLAQLWDKIQSTAAGTPKSPDRTTRPAARQLPPDIRDFTGRIGESSRLGLILRAANQGTSPPVIHITGPPGIGKTSLAVHIAHRSLRDYPDGQLFLHMGGAASPRDPAPVLGEVLRALGAGPADIPGTLAERAALYRSHLAGRRLLIVVDDVLTSDQVRALLPGGPGCALIVTSRNLALNLTGEHLIDLRQLPADESIRMLGRIIGARRVSDEPAAAHQIVRACDGYPLAVRIAGGRLAARPAWTLAYFAGLLGDQERRLDHLRTGEMAVRAHIASGYAALSDQARRAFRLLALAGPHDVPSWVMAALTNTPEAEDVIGQLLDKCMLTCTGVDATGQPRYRLHDLLRDYAAECLKGDSEAEPATVRMVLAWLQLVDHADAFVPREPYFPAPSRYGQCLYLSEDLARRLVDPNPARWLTMEFDNIRATVATACRAGRVNLAAGIVLRLTSFLHLARRHDEAVQLWQMVMHAATQGGNLRLAAQARFRAAVVIATSQGEVTKALPMVDRCVLAFEAAGDRWHLARALILRAHCLRARRRHGEALIDVERGLTIAQAVSDPHAEFSALRMLGAVHSKARRHQQAIDTCSAALKMARRLGEKSYQAVALRTLIAAHRRAGHLEPIPALCAEGANLAEVIGNLMDAAYFYENWGVTHQALDQHDQAITCLERAAELFASQEAPAAAARCRQRLAHSGPPQLSQLCDDL